MMRTVELWQRWFLLPWRCGCSLSESVFGKPVSNVRVNLHRYKMKLLFLCGPRLCVESRSVEQFHFHHNILVFSRSEDQVSNCVTEQLEYVLQPILFHAIREAFRTVRSLRCWAFEKTWHKLCDDTVDSVRCGYRECVRQRGRPTFPRASKTGSSTTGTERAPTQGPSNQCASQVAVTWRSNDERRHGTDGIHPWRLS